MKEHKNKLVSEHLIKTRYYIHLLVCEIDSQFQGTVGKRSIIKVAFSGFHNRRRRKANHANQYKFVCVSLYLCLNYIDFKLILTLVLAYLKKKNKVSVLMDSLVSSFSFLLFAFACVSPGSAISEPKTSDKGTKIFNLKKRESTFFCAHAAFSSSLMKIKNDGFKLMTPRK